MANNEGQAPNHGGHDDPADDDAAAAIALAEAAEAADAAFADPGEMMEDEVSRWVGGGGGGAPRGKWWVVG